MSRGRPPKGSRIVQHLAGSRNAKERLQVILQTVSGEKSVVEACAELGIGKTAFHELRTRALQMTLGDLEPKPSGRPAREVSPEQVELERLAAENERLRDDLEIAHVREELMLAMPEVFDPGKKTVTARPKKIRRNRRKRQKRKR